MWMNQAMLAIALAFAICGWVKGRPKGWIFPSDAFFLLTLLVTGIVPFVNVRADSPDLAKFSFKDETITSALLALTIMYTMFGCVWWLRKPILVPSLIPRSSLREKMWHQATLYSLLAAFAFFLISVIALSYPPYLELKKNVVLFMIGRIDAESYQIARRVTFVNDTFIGSIIGRLRYSIYPILYVGTMFFFIRKFNFLICAACAVFLTILGPASLSKAALVVFMAYFLIAFLLEREHLRPFRAINVIISLSITLPTMILILSLIYFMQYRNEFTSFADLPKAMDLSFYRLFVAIYQGLLQYFATFPGRGGYAGFSSISMLAPLFGLPTRDLDTEVAINFLGPVAGTMTSFPTIFIGNAYASFGYLGVAVFSIGVALFLMLVDTWLVRIRNRYVRIIYLATMTINVAHFAVLAAPAALITYGCGIIPIVLVLCDRLMQETARAKRARTALAANAQRLRPMQRANQ